MTLMRPLLALVSLSMLLALPSAAADPWPVPEDPEEVRDETLDFVRLVRDWVRNGLPASGPTEECVHAAIDNGPYPSWEPIASGEEPVPGGTRYWVRTFSTIYSITQYDDCDVGTTDPQSFPWP